MGVWGSENEAEAVGLMKPQRCTALHPPRAYRRRPPDAMDVSGWLNHTAAAANEPRPPPCRPARVPDWLLALANQSSTHTSSTAPRSPLSHYECVGGCRFHSMSVSYPSS